MDKKKRQPPKHLITLHRFEFTFEDVSPDNYVYYLEELGIDNLTLITEDSNIDSGSTAHTSFWFLSVHNPRKSGVVETWVKGTIHTGYDTDTVVEAAICVAWWGIAVVLGVYLVFPILAIYMGSINTETLPTISLVFALGFLLISIFTYIGVNAVKRDVIRQFSANIDEIFDKHETAILEKQKNKQKRG